MDDNQFHVQAISKLTLCGQDGSQRAEVQHVDICLLLSEHLEKSMYFEASGLPNQAGAMSLLAGFIQGLASTIQYGAEKGWWDRKKQVKYVIGQIQQSTKRSKQCKMATTRIDAPYDDSKN